MTRLSVRAAGAARPVLRPVLLIAAVVALVAAVVPLAAQQADAVLQGFEPTGTWMLVVDGKEVPKAEFYENQRAGAFLIWSSEFATPLLVEGQQVSSLQMLKVSKRADGRVDLLADAVVEPLATMQISGTDAQFKIEKKTVVMKPSPYKLGLQKGAALLDSNFGYRWRAKGYEPDATALGRLKGERRDVRVLTFFGSWCPHCSHFLPLLLRTEQRLADTKIRFDYYGLPQQGMTKEPEAAKWKIDGVPTAIVFVGDKEIGRIPSSGWNNPELALDLILHPGKAGG